MRKDWLTYLLTYSKVQSPSWEANWFAASQEIPRISRNPKFHYRTHKRPPTLSILGQPNPVHIPTFFLLEIYPNIIPPSTPRSPQCSLSLRFPHQDPILPPLFTHTESLWNHNATDHKEGEQLEDRRSVGESSCNSGDGTDQRVQSFMFIMMMMMMNYWKQQRYRTWKSFLLNSSDDFPPWGNSLLTALYTYCLSVCAGQFGVSLHLSARKLDNVVLFIAVLMKIQLLWDATSSQLVNICRGLGGC